MIINENSEYSGTRQPLKINVKHLEKQASGPVEDYRSNFGSKYNDEGIEESFNKKSMQSLHQNPDTVSKFQRPSDLSGEGKNLSNFLNDSKQVLAASR